MTSLKKGIVTSLLGIGLAVGTLGGLACGAVTDTGDHQPNSTSKGLGARDAAKDVKLGKMTADNALGDVEIKATVENHSSKSSNYNIEATVYDENGVKVGTAITFVKRVQAHGTAKATLTTTIDGRAHSYKLTQVARTAST